MTHVHCESKLRSIIKSSVHPCHGNWVAIEHTVVYYARQPTHLVQELNVGTVYRTGMSQNKLKLNADKTEALVMGTPQMRAKISIPSITVNGVIVPVLNEP